MARSMWSGAISFGLVNVPVRVFAAVSQKEIRFNMLHDTDGGRIHLKRVCSLDEKEVPYEEIATGSEISKGHYVKLSKEELQALDPEATRAIDIEDFVDLEAIDPIFYEHSYYLAPDKGAERAYALLLEAMRQTNKVGIARMVMRMKQYLCAIRPMGKVLAMATMQYADEIVSQDDIEGLPGKSAEPRERELEMAKQLVGSLTSDWKPEKYKDEHRERVVQLIEKKAQGEDIVAELQAPERPAKVVSLMDALQRSLEEGRRAAGGGKPVEERGEVRHRAQAARATRAKAHSASRPAHKKQAKRR